MLRSVVASPLRPWRSMLGIPVRTILPISAGDLVKLRKEIFVEVFPLRKGRRRTMTPIYCESAVARPAPAVPSFRTKIKIGSSIMFRIPPDARPIIAYTAMPSYRSTLLRTQETTMAGAASRMKVA